jgi:hypothetical protein
MRLLHEKDGFTHAYQVELNRKTTRRSLEMPGNLIWADWDHDSQIRAG